MAKGTCSVPGCSAAHYGHGLCNKHWLRVRNHGSTADPRPSYEAAFWAKVRTSDATACWEWVGSRRLTGYGTYRHKCAHRVAYELCVGPIPEGLELDHLCKTPSCVNPAHLEPVTHRENIRRSDNLAGLKARQTHCKRGHKFTPENTYVVSNGCRVCRTCHRMRRWHYKHALPFPCLDCSNGQCSTYERRVETILATVFGAGGGRA